MDLAKQDLAIELSLILKMFRAELIKDEEEKVVPKGSSGIIQIPIN